jgi:hypothetical protein
MKAAQWVVWMVDRKVELWVAWMVCWMAVHLADLKAALMVAWRVEHSAAQKVVMKVECWVGPRVESLVDCLVEHLAEMMVVS